MFLFMVVLFHSHHRGVFRTFTMESFYENSITLDVNDAFFISDAFLQLGLSAA